MRDPIIEAKGIRKTFGHTEVLKGIDFRLEQGEVVCVIGPSGSGKSTLLRCLNFLERPTAGLVRDAILRELDRGDRGARARR